MSSTRTIILEPAQGERGPEAPLAELLRRLHDLAGTLMAVGGEFVVRADRVKLGELPGTPEPCGKCRQTGRRVYDGEEQDCRACGGQGVKEGRPEVISETLGFMVTWRNVPQLSDDPLTARMMDHVLGPDEGREVPEDSSVTAEEVAAALAATGEGAELDDDGSDEDEE